MSDIELTNGQQMPLLGLGTWELRGRRCTEVVGRALQMGYRHIDTAFMYRNQAEVGEGLKKSGIDRGDVFVTTKIWQDALRYDQVMVQFQSCLEMLDLDYVDLLLIHWPSKSVPLAETLRAFDEIVSSGRTRNIGVSNFSNSQVDDAVKISQAPICNNQVEFHVGSFEESLWRHCNDRQIVLTAHRPLAIGAAAKDAALAKIGKGHGKTAAQVALRWLVQRDIVAIPKSSSEVHLRENMDIFSWALTDDEMALIDQQ